MSDLLKLTAYFGERDRAGGRFAGEAIAGAFVAHRLRLGIVMRGIGGFGVRHHLHEDRLLTLSEDLPLVAVGLDSPAAIEAALGEIETIAVDGLLTLERARPELPVPASEAIKLTVYVGRHERHGGRPLHQVITAQLRSQGFENVIVLLGVDGSIAGERRRARFLSANADVPLMVIAIGGTERLVPALAELRELLPDPLLSVERVRICRRAGRELGPPPTQAPHVRGAVWQKLMIYTTEGASGGGVPAHLRLLRDLRSHRGRGATTLRGVWGFHDGHDPTGDRLLQLGRRVPVVLVTVDTPERIAELYPLVARATAGGGIVTSEWVPAFRARGRGVTLGSLELAEL